MRQLIGAKFAGMKQTDWMAPVGFAYLTPSVYEVFKEGFTALKQSNIIVTLPEWFTRGEPREVLLRREDKDRLSALYNIEDRYVARLVKLDEVLDRALKEKKPIPLDELKEAARKFVEMAGELDEWRDNAFFAIFDKIVEAALKKDQQARVTRESAMVLEIMPDGKKRVRKALMRRS